MITIQFMMWPGSGFQGYHTKCHVITMQLHDVLRWLVEQHTTLVIWFDYFYVRSFVKPCHSQLIRKVLQIKFRKKRKILKMTSQHDFQSPPSLHHYGICFPKKIWDYNLNKSFEGTFCWGLFDLIQYEYI